MATQQTMNEAIMIKKIQSLAAEYLPGIIEIRRHIHANPELSFKEFKTSEYVKSTLADMGISNVKELAGTGIVARIEGENPDTAMVSLRADMDALPISEQNDVPYKSCNPGVMHACGHDVHTASLLGAAKILNELKSEWSGTVQLIFQPGEEVLPGGASIMIEEGMFQNQSPHAVFGQHVFPELAAGKVGFKPGIYMASTDEIYVTVKGKGGHGAKPDKNIDPVLITSHLIIALQQVVSRWANPTMPSVLSFGKVIANGATNIIPGEVTIEGTFRTFDESWRKEAHERMIALAEGLVKSMGGEVEFRIETGYPVLKNDADLTAKSIARAIEYLGEENVVPLDLRTTAEDFAYFTQLMPSCFYRLGTASPNGENSFPVHNSRFDIDENALLTGMGLMAWQAISELNRT